MLLPRAFLMNSCELMSRIFAFMNLPPVADALGSQRKLFSHRLVEQSLCVSAHAWEKNRESNRTMKDDALFHDIAIHCVFSSVYFDTLMHIFRQQFRFKWVKCWHNYNCFKYGATFAPLYLCHKHKQCLLRILQSCIDVLQLAYPWPSPLEQYTFTHIWVYVNKSANSHWNS